jgi:hypothetical protein
LRDGGANIEGMAVRNRQMFVGFRAPSPDGKAFIVRIAVDAIFGNAAAEPQPYRLNLGQDRQGRDLGIRDITAVSDGFLVLAGPSLPEGEDAIGSGRIFHWQENQPPVSLLDVPVERKGMKPEVLLLLKDDPEAYRVLVMHDHVAGGAQVEFRIPKQ